MQLATSTDLYTWERYDGNPLFTDGFDGRDPMVKRIGDQWVMYYTANSEPSGGNHIVAYRTSQDLMTWSERQVAFTHPKAGTFGGPTESPFVVERDGSYYLFVCCDAGYSDTRVYRSDDPLHFDVSQLVGQIDEHAAEVVQDDERWWVSGAGWGQGGVYLRPLDFEGQRVTAGRTIATPSYRLTVQTHPSAAITSMDVREEDGAWTSVLDDGYRGTAPYLAIGTFGDTDPTGIPGQVLPSDDGTALELRDVPLGAQPVTLDWQLDFAADHVDSTVDFTVNGPTTAPVWEVAWTLDSALDRIGDDADPDRSTGDVPGFPRWAQASSDDATVAAAYRPGSAWSQDNRFVDTAPGAFIWQPLWQPGGRSWAPGQYAGGTWRMGVSATGHDDTLGARLWAGVS